MGPDSSMGSVNEDPASTGGTSPFVRVRALRRGARNFLLSEQADAVGLAAGLLVLALFLSFKSPYFLSTENFTAIGVAASMYIVMASVQTVVLTSGGIDLSITATLALAGVATEMAMLAGLPFPLQLGAGIGVGVGVGLLNSLVIVVVGVNPLIATIGMQFLVRGVAYLWTKAEIQSYFTNQPLNWLANGTIVGIPFPIVLSLTVFLIVLLTMRFTRFGSRVFAVGGSEYATRLAGISVPRMRMIVYVLSGVSAAFGGILLTAMNGTADAQAGMGEELTIIGAVIIGGTGLAGGRGTVFGTLLGVLLLGTLQNGLNLIGVQPFWQTFIQGAILIAAVTSDEIRRKLRDR